MPRHSEPARGSTEGSAASHLWEEADCARWEAALAAYAGAVEARGGPKLLTLDHWYHDALPAAVRARAPAHLTRDDLLQVVRWKMGRGVWRATNLGLAAGNADADVEAATASALALVPDPVTPVRALARLRGVGAATASAVLAALHPEHYPFLDDLVAAQIPGLGPPAFTVPYYTAYAAALRSRAADLAAACAHQAWSPHALDRALWAAVQRVQAS